MKLGRRNNIVLSGDNKLDFIDYEGKIFLLEYIDPENRRTKGGNSYVFKLIDPDHDIEDRVIKFSKIYRPLPKDMSFATREIRRKFLRFENEIVALRKAQESSHIIDIFFDGIKEIRGKNFRFYVMEKADSDLTEYILKNQDADEQERLKLCYQLFLALKELDSLDIYHRDIKPDNIFVFYQNEEPFNWKIGDLGLIAYRDKDFDRRGEKIGPFGWLSPEAMNKCLTEVRDLGLDCAIDNQSDIFQLGKVFWFIYQNNVPIGQIYKIDFRKLENDMDSIFNMIKSMLNYSKARRSTIPKLRRKFKPLVKSLGI